MRNVTNILICNLSVSDIILAGIILPQNLHDISHEDDFHEGPFLCKVAFAFPILCITSASYTLATMAFERRNCIVDSLKTQITNRHCKFIIPSVWVIAFLAATPTIIEFQVVDQQTIEDNKTEIHQACNSDMVPRAFVIGNGIMLLFVTYIVPLKSRGSDGSESASSVTFLVKIALAAFSTAYNVVLYVTFNPMFRQAFLRIFMCNRKKQNKVAAVSDLDTQNRPIERSRGVLATADTSVEPTFCKP
ncbi:unnamed protein product [Mytilus edulis]|uniref:G-protein coupled receptors family 1 profile domain-containing protein n=1 Tax=Mytilus edulis TaxID=6550 RepID=A0A8S3RRB5_MYTED|nr:unnamed protein product [Mytilus edulis]